MSNEEIIKLPNALKLQGLPDDTCFTSFADLLKALVKYMSVEIPTSITNVIISNIQPLDSQRSSLWIRMTNGGDFVGFYLFSGGAWQQIFPVDNQLFRVYGDSRVIPTGFVLGDDGSLGLTAAQIAFLHTQWLLDPTSTFYVIFDVARIPL